MALLSMYSINIHKRHSDCFTEIQINWKNLLFMYRNKYISLLKYVDTLPPPSKLDKKILLVISLHKGIWVRDGLGRRKCIIISNVNVKNLSKVEQFFCSDKLNKHTTYNHHYWKINTKKKMWTRATYAAIPKLLSNCSIHDQIQNKSNSANN